MLTRLLISGMLLFSVASAQDVDPRSSDVIMAATGPYLGQYPPGSKPKLFATEFIPVDGIEHCVPTFGPDGREAFWTTFDESGERPRGVIWTMKEQGKIWSRPKVAPFSGEFNDHNPVFSNDGTRLHFSSVRPGGLSRGRNLWYVERTDTGWSEPKLFEAPPNSEIGVSQASFTDDGTIYFAARMDSVQWSAGIYRSRPVGGVYAEPEALPPHINTPDADLYPFIAPDESFLLFGSTRPGAKSTETDLYISYRSPEDTWSDPIHLDSVINNGHKVSFSRLSADGKYLFFNRFDESGTDRFYWIDASILEAYRP